jgi:hypothetical protein
MPTITPEPILKIATGFMAAKQLFAASEIGLFEALADGPAGLEDLAGKTAVPARTLGIVAARQERRFSHRLPSLWRGSAECCSHSRLYLEC